MTQFFFWGSFFFFFFSVHKHTHTHTHIHPFSSPLTTHRYSLTITPFVQTDQETPPKTVKDDNEDYTTAISQFIILIQFSRFQQSTHLHGSFTFGHFSRLLREFTFLGVEFGVIARELLELDEEISEMNLEFVEVAIISEQSIDKRRDLSPEMIFFMLGSKFGR